MPRQPRRDATTATTTPFPAAIPVAHNATAGFDDNPPPLTRREAAEIGRASSISTADIDAAGGMWRRYAGAGLGGLWDAG